MTILGATLLLQPLARVRVQIPYIYNILIILFFILFFYYIYYSIYIRPISPLLQPLTKVGYPPHVRDNNRTWR